MRSLSLVLLAAVALAYGQEPAEEAAPAATGGETAEAVTVEEETPVFVEESESGSITGSGTATEPAAQEGSEGTTEETPMGCMGTGGITGLLPIIGMVAIFYFLIIRPQQKQQKRLREMRSNLQRGDRVVTAGGIHGVISNMRNDVVTVKIADGVKIEVDKNSLTLSMEGAPDQESS